MDYCRFAVRASSFDDYWVKGILRMKTALRAAILLLLVVVIPVHGQQGDVLRLKADHPNIYVVKKGDTLWKISRIFLEDPWLWPELWHYNQQLDDPHLIYPGDILKLVWIDGRPRLVFLGDEPKPVSRDERLQPRMRAMDLASAIPAIELDKISAFLSRSRVVSDDELERAPYVLVGRDGHLLSGAGDEIYGRGNFPEDDVMGIFRRGQRLVDPDSGEFLGIQARDIGTARMNGINASVASLSLTRSTMEVRGGDRFLPEVDSILQARFQPTAPEQTIEASVLLVENGLDRFGQLQSIAISKGQREGLKPGDILAVYQRASPVRDPVTQELVRLPDERAGLMMIFRSFEKVSYGLVLTSERTMKVGDRARNP